MDQMQLRARNERSRFGLRLTRYSISLLVVMALVLCAAAAMAADIPTPTPTVVRLLPAANEVKGWQVYPDTLVYAKGEALTEIYNGGYELYTKNGVQDAAQQMYRRNKEVVTVTTHQLDTLNSTRKFYKHWEATDKKQSTYKKLPIVSQAYMYTAKGTSNGYLFRGKYFITVEVNVGGKAGLAIAEAYLRAISAKYAKLT